MGTIETRHRKSGETSYRVKWDDPVTRRPQSQTFPTLTGARKFNAKLIMHDHRLPPEQSTVQGGPITLSEYAPKVIALSRGSARYRKDILHAFVTHIEPHLGHLAVATIGWGDIVEWQDKLVKAGCAVNSIAGYRSGVLGPVFKRAQQLGPHGEAPIRTMASPLLIVPVPKDENPYEKEILTRSETPAFFRAAYEVNQKIADLLYIMAATGMRWSEASALTPRAVNFEGGYVRVKQVFTFDEDYQPYLKLSAKSRSGNRDIPIGPGVIKVLHRVCEGKGWDELLFTNRTGKPLAHSTFRKTFLRILRKAKGYGLPDKKLTPHGIRHSLLTHLGHNRIDSPTMKGVAGWANMRMGEVYIKASDQNHGDVVEASESFLDGALEYAKL